MHRPVDVRPHRVGRLVELVLRLDHPARPFVQSLVVVQLNLAPPRSSETDYCRGAAAWRCSDGLARAARAALAPERVLEDVLDVVGEDELELGRRLRRQVVQVGLVLEREDHALQACALCCEHLLPDASDRQHLAGERDLTGHPDVVVHRHAAHERDEGRRHRHAGRRAVLRHRARRDVDVDVVLGEPRRRHAELVRVRADPGKRRLGRLLHHLAELARDRQLALPGVGGGLDEEDVAADRGVGEPRRDAWIRGALAGVGGERARPEPLADAGLVDLDLLRVAASRPWWPPCGRAPRSAARDCARRPRACTRRSRGAASGPGSRCGSSAGRVPRSASARGSALRSRASRRGCSRRGGSRPSGRAADQESCRACSRCR